MLVGDVDAIENYIRPILMKQMVFPDATYFVALACVGVVTIMIQAILVSVRSFRALLVSNYVMCFSRCRWQRLYTTCKRWKGARPSTF